MKKLLLPLLSLICIAASAQTHTPVLPAADKPVERQTLPQPVLKTATTTIDVHLTVPSERVGTTILYYTDPFTGESKQFEPTRSDNTLTWKLEQYATQQLRVGIGDGSLVPLVNPGETIEIHLDVKAFKMHLRGDKNVRYVYYATGDFRHENNILAMYPTAGNFNKRNYSYMAHGIKMPVSTIDASVHDIISRIERDNIAVDTLDFSGAAKELLRLDNVTMGLRQITSMKSYLQIYRYGTGINMVDNMDKLGALDRLDLTDMKLIYGTDFALSVPMMAMAFNKAGITPPEGWLRLGPVLTALKKAQTREPITDADRAAMNGALPYYKELFAHYQNTTEAQYADAMDSGAFVIRDTPTGADTDVLAAIVAQYPGKVVFVDFWATWCGPCLAAMRTMKDIKPWMKEQGVVSVYLTNPTSPKTRWTLALPDIGGEHYYLTDAQWRAITQKYGFNTIPTYMIFGRDGAKSFQKSGYPGNEAVKVELQKAAR